MTLALGFLTAVAPATSVRAQEAVPDSVIKKLASRLVRVDGPGTVTIDPRTKTVEIKLVNPTSDSALVEISAQFGPLTIRPKQTLAAGLVKDDSLLADSLLRDSLRTDSLGKVWSVESWFVENFPMQVNIAPNQTATVTLHVQTPPSLKPGEYSAHVMVKTMMVQEVDMSGMAAAMDAAIGGGTGGGPGTTSAQTKGKVVLRASDELMPPAVVKTVYKVP